MTPAAWSVELPIEIPMRAILYGDGAKGSYVQIHGCDELGLQRVIACASRNQAANQTWTADKFPHREFASLADLRAAWNADIPIRPCAGWQTARGAGMPCSNCARFCGGDLIAGDVAVLATPDFVDGVCPLRVPLFPEDEG